MPDTAQKSGFDRSILVQRKGPLPVWAWLLIGLLVVFVIMWWRNNRSSASASASAYSDLPNQAAPPVVIVPPGPSPIVNVGPFNPPAGTPPTAPPAGGAPPPTTGGLPPENRISVGVGDDIYRWMNSLNERYPALHLDFGKLDMYNPGWRKYIRWVDNPAHPAYKDAFFYKPAGVTGLPPLRVY